MSLTAPGCILAALDRLGLRWLDKPDTVAVARALRDGASPLHDMVSRMEDEVIITYREGRVVVMC
jgi:hypothetical protein